MGTVLAMTVRIRFLLLILLSLGACTETRLEGSVPLDGPAVTARPTVAVPAVPGERLLAEIVADGRSGSYFRNARNGPHVTWAAADESALVTRDGLLTATFGLGYDLLSADVSEARALIRSRRSGRATRVHRYLDGENQVVTRAFLCDLDTAGEGTEYRRIVEACQGADIAFENDYVLAADGRIVTSRQWVGPEIGRIRITRVAPGQQGPVILVAGN